MILLCIKILQGNNSNILYAFVKMRFIELCKKLRFNILVKVSYFNKIFRQKLGNKRADFLTKQLVKYSTFFFKSKASGFNENTAGALPPRYFKPDISPKFFDTRNIRPRSYVPLGADSIPCREAKF